MSNGQARAQQASVDATLACEAAASRAERAWRLPAGLLAAIGIIESGRRAPNGVLPVMAPPWVAPPVMAPPGIAPPGIAPPGIAPPGIWSPVSWRPGIRSPVIWPWTINAGGRGFYHPTKAAAVDMVRGLQRTGFSIIDVGCFQVDLFYHPHAFASLDEAFDPDANARAAARILSLGRLGSTGWDGAIAAYHSGSLLLGAAYLRKVRAVWPWARAHPPWDEREPPSAAYVALLSAQARLVRVVTPETAVAASTQPSVLPRVVPAGRLLHQDRAGATVEWLHPPVDALPVVLSPIDARRGGSR